MKKYVVTVTETIEKEVEVMAENKLGAEEQVKAMYEDGKVDMGYPDSISHSFSEAYLAD